MKTERNLTGTTSPLPPQMGELTKRSRKLLNHVLQVRNITTEQITEFIPRGTKGISLTNAIVAITQFFTDQGIFITYTTPSKILLRIAHLRSVAVPSDQKTVEAEIAPMKIIDRPTVINQLQTLRFQLGATPTYSDIKKSSDEGLIVSVSTILKMFGSYENLLIDAGINPNSYKYDRESLVDDLRFIYLELNRVPSPEDIIAYSEKGLTAEFGAFQKMFKGMEDIQAIIDLYVMPGIEVPNTKEKALGRPRKNPLLLTKDQEKIVALKIATGDDKAREDFAKANLRLVYWVAKKFFGDFVDNSEFGITIDDLFQEGYRGLLKAIDKFDPTMDYKFSTYAVWWIRQTIERSFNHTSETVRIPVHMIEKMRKYNKFVAKYFRRNGVPPYDSVVEAELGLSSEELHEILNTTQIVSIKLEGSSSAEEDTPAPIDVIESDMSTPPDEAVDLSLLKEKIKQIISKIGLSERDYEMLSLRFGLDGKGEHTLEEIGEKFNLTRERVRQINEKILLKMRSHFLSADLKMFF